MNFDFRPFFVLWAVLAIGVLALFIWRKSVAGHEDDSLHVLHGALVRHRRRSPKSLMSSTNGARS